MHTYIHGKCTNSIAILDTRRKLICHIANLRVRDLSYIHFEINDLRTFQGQREREIVYTRNRHGSIQYENMTGRVNISRMIYP